MPKKEPNWDMYSTQLSNSMSFTSFMAGMVMFFAGILMTQSTITMWPPTAFLIISVFGFLYSTLIYNTAGEELVQKNLNRYLRCMKLGDILSSYTGIYMLILSLPLVVNMLTANFYLNEVTIIATLIGLAIYQFSSFSVAERHFKGRDSKILSVAMIAAQIILLASQIFSFYFDWIAFFFIMFILLITYLASRGTFLREYDRFILRNIRRGERIISKNF